MRKLVTAICFGIGISITCAVADAATGKVMIIFRSAPRSGTQSSIFKSIWPAYNYGVTVRSFTAGTMNNDFGKELAGAGILMVARGAAGDADAVLFRDRKYTAAVSDFLQRGGVLLFQYQSYNPGGQVEKYLNGIGVSLPKQMGSGYYNPVVADVQHPLLRKPNDLRKFRFRGNDAYGWWEAHGPQQTALYHAKGVAARSALIVQDRVLGRGTVLFSRLFRLTGSSSRGKLTDPACVKLIENLYARAFGKLSFGVDVRLRASGEVADGRDMSGGLRRRQINQLYFRGLVNKVWWKHGGKWRIPVLVHENIGQSRPAALIEVACAFPANVKPGAIRVTTPWGEEAPSQVVLRESGMRVLFSARLLPYQHRMFFIYGDDSGQTAAAYECDLALKQEKKYYVLENAYTQVRIRRDRPRIVMIRARGNSTGNQLADDFGHTPESYGIHLRTKAECLGSKVTADGPLCKRIEYALKVKNVKMTMAFTLVAGSRGLYYEYRAGGASSMERSHCWLPGNGLNLDTPDMFYFAGSESLVRLRFTEPKLLFSDIRRKMGEGWYAFRDAETGQIISEFFDLGDIAKVWCYIHGTFGYNTRITTKVTPNGTKGAYVVLPDNGSLGQVRREYLAFKNPPQVMTCGLQTRDAAPVLHPPVFGKDQWRSLHESYGWSAISGLYEEDPDGIVEHVIRAMKSQGCNCITYWPYSPFWQSEFTSGRRQEFLGELVKKSHAAGMVVQTGLPYLSKRFFGKKTPQGFNEDFLEYRALAVQAARELGAYDVDMVLLRDEDCYTIKSNAARQAFKKQYNMEPVRKILRAELSRPATHCTVLFNMDTYTGILKDMAAAFREGNRRAWLGDQVNFSSMTNLARGAPHDLERHSGFLTTLTMDLYGRPRASYKYCVRLLRGMFGNDTPVSLYVGCSRVVNDTRENMLYMLMWGTDGLFHFPNGRAISIDALNTAAETFRFMEYTGLGDLTTRMEPLRRMAVLRNRAAIVDCIKKGQWQTFGSMHEVRVKNLASLPNLAVAIIFSKHFKAGRIRKYPVMYLTSDACISAGQAKEAIAYVNAGGKLVCEAECALNPELAAAMGVRVNGGMKQYRGACSGKRGFAYSGQALAVKADGAVAALRAKDGNVLLYRKALGKGEFLFTPLILSNKAGLQEDIAAYVRLLVQELSGKPPITLRVDDMYGVDSSILTDGKAYICGIYNSSISDREPILTYNGNDAPEVIVDFASGSIVGFDGSARVRAPRGRVSFFYLGSRAGIKIPEIRKLKNGQLIYSNNPGTDVVALRAAADSAKQPSGQERARKPGFSYVAVFTDKNKPTERRASVMGDEGMFASLQNRDKLIVEYIWDLASDTLAHYDAILIPNIGPSSPPSGMGKGWEDRLRDYVQKGGSVMLCHHAIGYPSTCGGAPFPEIGSTTTAYVQLQDIVITAMHPVTNARSIRRRFPAKAKDPAFSAQISASAFMLKDTFRTGFPDYIPIKTGPQGTVLARGCVAGDKGGEPVLVIGTFGKGKVVLCGLAVGRIGAKKEVTTKGDERILLNAVYWMTER